MTVITRNTTSDCTPRATRRTLWSVVAQMIAVRQQRGSLQNLEAHMLQDIGITRKDALKEAEKPFWDVPAHWTK